MLYAQLSGAASLRLGVGRLHSHANRLSHLGAAPCARSTLANANHGRPAAVLADLLAAIISPLAFARLVRDNLTDLRRVDDLAKPPRRTPAAGHGTSLAIWEQHQEPCRTAVGRGLGVREAANAKSVMFGSECRL